MSLQTTVGPGKLVSLGISVSDVATFYGLAKRVGNWLTAASGDQILLDLLDQDEMEIIRRRGLIDIRRFNKTWGSRMVLLANGKPTSFSGEDAEKNLDTFSRFTAIMVCTVAALEAFIPRDVVKQVLRNVLVELLKTTEFGEDVLVSQYNNRINSWRSAADIRGLSGKARQIRQHLLQRGVILDGLMPAGDSPLMVHFLVWLIAGDTAKYTTPSSDVAGVGACLSHLGIDVLSVGWLGEEPDTTPCQLQYSQNCVYGCSIRDNATLDTLSRFPCTTVSLQHPEESLTKFPIDGHTSNRCRDAWRAGQKAASYVDCVPYVQKDRTDHSSDDLTYAFYDKGSESVRTRAGIASLAEGHGFVVNKELCHTLQQVFQRESDATIDWLIEQTDDSSNNITQVVNPKFKDADRINAFTVFQAFFMGYYYSVFLRLVDTSGLQVQVVDGYWGFRSVILLCNMKILYLSSITATDHRVLILRREDVISILSMLLAATPRLITRVVRDSYNRDNWCLGAIGQRSLLVRSLLSPCYTMRDIGKFVLLDVDVSGIPADSHGLIRPGLADQSRYERDDPNMLDVKNLGLNTISEPPVEDVSFHIEADWDGDPDTILQCVRYKGRRITIINPAVADVIFCATMVPPILQPQPLTDIATIEWTAQQCLSRRHLPPNDRAAPYILRIPGRPRMRYAALYWYYYHSIARSSSNCLRTSVLEAREEAQIRGFGSYVIITGFEDMATVDEWVPPEIDERISKLLEKRRNNPNRAIPTVLGDAKGSCGLEIDILLDQKDRGPRGTVK